MQMNPFNSNPSLGPPSPFATNKSLASVPPPMASGVFPGVSPMGPPIGGPNQGGEVVIEISRLLDMPMQTKMFSGDLKQYKVRVLDDVNGVPAGEIAATRELAGIIENVNNDGDGVDTETVRLGPEGIVRFRTQSSVFHLVVEYAGGFVGNMKIGRCRIARSDQRSQELWPYALSNKNGELVGCGIELKVRDMGGPPMPGMPPTAGKPPVPGSGPVGPSFHTMPPPGSGPLGGPPFQSMPPLGTGTPPMPPPGSGTPPGPGGPSFRTMPPMGPPTSGPMSAPGPGGPPFQTMPPMGPPGSWPMGPPPGSGPMGPPGAGGPPFQTMPPMGMPNSGPMPPPGSGPMGPSFQTMPPMGPPPGSGPMGPLGHGGPSFQTMPPMGPPPGSEAMGPSFQTMPPMGMPPSDPFAMHGGMGPPPMSGMMPPSQLQPHLFPNNQNRSWGISRATIGGRNVEEFLNQLIQANGPANPTQGATLKDLFGSDEEFVVYGHGVKQRDPDAIFFKTGQLKSIPVKFAAGAPPPYDLTSLFRELPNAAFAPVLPTQTAAGPGVVAIVEIEKVIDIPGPDKGEIALALQRTNSARALDTCGPFPSTPQGGPGSLRTADCNNCKMATRMTMADLSQGSVQLKIAVTYNDNSFMSTMFGRGNPQVGVTVPFEASWKPETKKYVALMAEADGGEPRPVGGLYISYRFAQDTQETYDDVRKSKQGLVEPKEQKVEQVAMQGATDDIAGVSGKFQRGTQEEVLECAALAIEAQNRALHQRVQIAKSAKQVDEERKADESRNRRTWRLPTNYRDWKDLESLFVTMGPNYVAMSPEVGATICKCYEEDSSIWQELQNAQGPGAIGEPKSVEEELEWKRMISQATNNDPDKVFARLRPLISKNVTNVQREGVANAHDHKPRLKIKVFSAANLRTRQGFLSGQVHPKVVVEIPGKPGKWESRPAQDGRNVEWNQDGFINNYEHGDHVIFKVVDKDWVGFDDHLGEARLSSGDFYPDPFHARLPLSNGGKHANTNAASTSRATIMVEVSVVEPGQFEWPPHPAIYAPLENLNPSDRESQRLANWDVHQCAKLPFVDVNPNYQMGQDVWGAGDTSKAIGEGYMLKTDAWKAPRVKDECLMA